MRPSDQILHDDLQEAGLPHLAERAAKGEWNDFFGEHAMPQNHLMQTLREEVKIANVARKRLIQAVIDGKYDATREESDEWAASPEGMETSAKGNAPRDMDEEAFMAAVDLVERTGAKGLQIGYLHDNVPSDEADWYAFAQYQGARIIEEKKKDPVTAVEGLARKLLTGGKCMHCQGLIALSDFGAYYTAGKLMDGTEWTEEQARTAKQCRWRRVGRRWIRGCEASENSRS